MVEGKARVLSHLLHSPQGQAKPVWPHIGLPASPWRLSITSHAGTAPWVSQQLGLGAGALHGAVGACRSSAKGTGNTRVGGCKEVGGGTLGWRPQLVPWGCSGELWAGALSPRHWI